MGRLAELSATASASRDRIAVDCALGLAGPSVLTAILVNAGGGQPRDYVFLYLGVVALLGVGRGLLPAIVAAGASFLLVDWYFVPPFHMLSIADEQDIVNLAVFISAAALVGGLGSRRRRSQLEAQALAQRLADANVELARLNREQAEAASIAVRLARTEQQVRVLAESDRVRREFLSNVSHELRTPLAGILTLSTALAGRPEVTPAIQGDVEAVVGQARRLDRLVRDMLDMARIEGSTLDLQLEPVTVHAAVEAAVERLHQTAPSRRVDVDVDSELAVVADWGRLGQILDNLLANADRFAPEGTAMGVRAGRGARDMIVVRVSDEGPGIAPELREHVFERFVRGSSGHDGAGTGLGLAIVRGLVEAHAGRVWLDDPRNGEGTTVAFALPAAQEG